MIRCTVLTNVRLMRTALSDWRTKNAELQRCPRPSEWVEERSAAILTAAGIVMHGR